MKDYYQILGVRRGAGLPEIRRAYRILVQKLHPDVNPDPSAHELIKEVNEAYDVLGDEAKKREYDYMLTNPHSTEEIPVPPAHRDPAYKRRGRPPHPVEKSQRLKLMERSLSFFRWVFKIAAVFCFVLFMDFVIPRKITTEQIVEASELFVNRRRGGGKQRHYNDMLITNTGRMFQVDREVTKLFQADPVIHVYESRILSITTKIETQSKSYVLTNFATVYNNFIFLPILIAVGSVAGLIVKKGTLDFNFSLGLVILVLLGITIKLML